MPPVSVSSHLLQVEAALPGTEPALTAMGKEAQAKVLNELETTFFKGVQHTGKTTGLGADWP